MQDDFSSWQNDNFNQSGHNNPPTPSYPMKWHKFLIYFALWAGAILNVLSALTYLTGTVYSAQGVEAEQVYRVFGGLKGLDVLYGVLLIGLGVIQIFTRFQLAGFKRNGPSLLLVTYAAGLIVSLLYGVIGAGILGTSITETINPVSIGVTIGMIAANKGYYDKRKELFIH